MLDAIEPSKVVELLKQVKTKDAAMRFLEGEAHRQLGSFEAAIASYAKALAICEDAEGRMDALLALAACYRTLGHSAAAYEMADESLQMANELEMDDYAVRSMQEMGMALRAWGRLEEALDMLDVVLSYYEQQKDWAGMSFICWAKGGIFRLQGHFEDGIRQFKESIRLAKKAGDDSTLADGYCG